MTRKKKKITKDFYRLDKILKVPASYYMIIGERSNGKTYSVKEHMLQKASQGGMFIYLRRRHKYVTRAKMYALFDDMESLQYELFGTNIKYTTDLGFYVSTEEGNKTIGKAVAIEDGMDMKGIPFEKITTILFDEFIDYSYFEDEIPKFLNLISTIVRERTNVEIFMLGNTIARYSPYFTAFGIDASKLVQGKIHYFAHKNGATVSLEYCLTRSAEGTKKKHHKYLGLDDNETVRMILYGEFDQKEVQTENIDGIGWNCRRRKIPLYITATGDTFELSLYEKRNPILFVRRINTQQGKVSVDIKYNLSFDNSVQLVSKNGLVPFYKRISTFFDIETIELMKIAKECCRTGRVVYDNSLTGTEFERMLLSF